MATDPPPPPGQGSPNWGTPANPSSPGQGSPDWGTPANPAQPGGPPAGPPPAGQPPAGAPPGPSPGYPAGPPAGAPGWSPQPGMPFPMRRGPFGIPIPDISRIPMPGGPYPGAPYPPQAAPPGTPFAPPQPPPSMGQPPAQAPAAPGSYLCPWCGMSSQNPGTSCPSCGAPVDVRAIQDTSGWTQLPAVKDMARIQFGQSTCQIEGTVVPVADVSLDGAESVYFMHHTLLFRDDAVKVETMRMRGGWSRTLAGMPLVMLQASGKGHIAFSHDAAGEIVALPIQVGSGVEVREHTMLIASGATAYDWVMSGIFFMTQKGNDSETHFPMGQFLDRFTAPRAPGLVLLHAKGNAFVRRLGPGESMLIKPTALLYKDLSVSMQLHFEHPGGTWRSWRSWGNRYLWLRCIGPGRVAVESAFVPVEDPGFDLRGSSPATNRQW